MPDTLSEDGDPVGMPGATPVPVSALESGKWLEVESRAGIEAAKKEIMTSTERHNRQQK